MDFLKSNYPNQQIILWNSIHLRFAQFSEKNIQPEECYANGQDLYLEAYGNALKEATSIWVVFHLSIYYLSGLYPVQNVYSMYFENVKTDVLHPNSAVIYRLAKTIE